MEFEDLKGKVGFGFAVVLYHEKLTEEFLNSLDVHEWADVFKEAPYNHPIKKQAVKMVEAAVEPYVNWDNLYRYNYPNEIANIAMGKMIETVSNVNDCLHVFRYAIEHGHAFRVCEQAFKKAISLGLRFSQCLTLYKEIIEGEQGVNSEDCKKMVFDQLSKLAINGS